MMKFLAIFIIIHAVIACNLQATDTSQSQKTTVPSVNFSNKDSIKIQKYYLANKGNNLVSQSTGSVSRGSLKNGKLFPFFGNNYTYFDTSSYFGKRAFTNENVLSIILKSYTQLANEVPNRHFYLMELSNECGGKMFPHKTHQNGMSADFMMPKIKDGSPFYALDTLGSEHYWLDFNDNGEYTGDNAVKIDFNLIAQHILILQDMAKNQGYKIAKVIIKIEYKDDLLKTKFGQILKASEIYIVKSLTPLINNLHDDHFHIDFEKI